MRVGAISNLGFLFDVGGHVVSFLLLTNRYSHITDILIALYLKRCL